MCSSTRWGIASFASRLFWDFCGIIQAIFGLPWSEGHIRLDSIDCHRRWDQCWVRLLDGMLQLSVAGTRDYELRIPTRIRSIVINNATGTEDGQILVRSAYQLSRICSACFAMGKFLGT